MTTERYIALLRGINVGRAKRIAMGDLCRLIAELGYDDVRSLLNSGNVVFGGTNVEPAAAAAAIEEALVLKLGVAARVTVLSRAEFATVVAENPLLPVALEPARLLVFIFTHPGDGAQLAALAAREWEPEALALGSRAAYVWCPDGVLDSRAASALGKLLGDGTTSRNWNTIRKLDALAAEASGADGA